MRQLRFYIETSVWSMLLADDVPERKAATETFFSEVARNNFEIYISEVVITEINKTRDPDKRRKLLSLIERYNPEFLEINEEVRELTHDYIERGLLSASHTADILHLAVSTVNDLDVVISWNLKHLVKRSTRIITNSVNRLNGYKDIEICRPEEVD
jgi:predicted nucleic acid-binding protein